MRSPATAVAGLGAMEITMRMRKTVTPTKNAANKRNAAGSTGPKTPWGQFIASRNSVRHGIFSRGMLLPGESEKEYERLRSEMINSKCPVGSGELLQVEILVWNEWRLKRDYRAEAGEIAKSLADHEPADVATSRYASHYNQAVKDVTKLAEIKTQIDAEAHVSPENLDWLRTLPYGEPVGRFLDVIALAQAAERGERARPDPDVSAAEESGRPTSAKNAPAYEDEGEQEFARLMLLNALTSLEETIRVEQVDHFEKLIRRAAAECHSAQVPQEGVLDRLMRYESQLLRNLYRAEHALERMQRLRRGHKVPAPSARVD
jgi:hypothetical protein